MGGVWETPYWSERGQKIVQVKTGGMGNASTLAAQQVLIASRKLERAIEGVYKAEQRRDQSAAALRARIADLITTTARELENAG